MTETADNKLHTLKKSDEILKKLHFEVQYDNNSVVLSQDLLLFKYRCLKIFKLVKSTVLLPFTKIQQKYVEDNFVSLKAIDDLTFTVFVVNYINAFELRMHQSDDFVDLLYNVLKYPIKGQRYSKAFRKLNKCEVCRENESEEVHHLIDVAHGGNSETYNLISVCNNCHKNSHYCFELIQSILSKGVDSTNNFDLDLDKYIQSNRILKEEQ